MAKTPILFSHAEMAIDPTRTAVDAMSKVHLTIFQDLDSDGLTTSATSIGGRESLKGELFSKRKYLRIILTLKLSDGSVSPKDRA